MSCILYIYMSALIDFVLPSFLFLSYVRRYKQVFFSQHCHILFCMKWIKILICLNCSGNGCTASENIRSKYVILNIALPVYTDKKGSRQGKQKKILCQSRSEDQTILRSFRVEGKHSLLCVYICVCDECLILSGEISDISGAETDDILLIRGKGR